MHATLGAGRVGRRSGRAARRNRPVRDNGSARASRYLFATTGRVISVIFCLTHVVVRPYTTLDSESANLAFLRKRGNAFYLVHNVRRGGKVKQLHLACLGDRPRLTDKVIRQVRRNHPLLELNWNQLRKQLDNRVALLVTDKSYLGRLVQHLHGMNLELADLAPQLLPWGASAETTAELVALLKLLRSTIEIKLRQFDRVSLVSGSSKTLR